MKKFFRSIFLLLFVLILQNSFLFSSKACAPAPRLGGKINISEESAIIIWNSRTKTEHFIRNAVFNTSEKDFGFLVPTPSVPDLGAMSIPVFARLEQHIQPKIEHQTKNEFVFSILSYVSSAIPLGMGYPMQRFPVRVIDQQQIGGYDTVILEADDAKSLATWLSSRGYANSPSLSEWLTPYIAMKWKITAFRIIQPVEDDVKYRNVSPDKFLTSPVRMSFLSDQPFFPYREPQESRQDTQSPERKLQVFFFSDSKVEGNIKESSIKWPGKVIWADKINDPSKILGYDIPLDELPSPLWLTVFEDNSNPRLGTNDLFFSTDKGQEPVYPPPMIVFDRNRKIVIPLDLILPILGVASFLYSRKTRKTETN